MNSHVESAIAFLERRADEDEQWALAASKPYPYAVGDPQTDPNGAEWTWGVGKDWEPVTVDPMVHEFVSDALPGGWTSATLISVREWQCEYGKPINQPYGRVEEMDASAGGHIVRHDPRRAVQGVKAVREIISKYRIAYPGNDADVEAESMRFAYGDVILTVAYTAGWRPS